MSENQFIFDRMCCTEFNSRSTKRIHFRDCDFKKTRRAQQRDSNFYSIMMSLSDASSREGVHKTKRKNQHKIRKNGGNMYVHSMNQFLLCNPSLSGGL